MGYQLLHVVYVCLHICEELRLHAMTYASLVKQLICSTNDFVNMLISGWCNVIISSITVLAHKGDDYDIIQQLVNTNVGD